MLCSNNQFACRCLALCEHKGSPVRSELNVEKANRLDDQANYLDLTFIVDDNNKTFQKLYNKRGDLNFHIVNFLFLSSNIVSDPLSYDVYILQLIRCDRCYTYYDDFGYRHKLLLDRLFSRGYKGNQQRNLSKDFMAAI